MHLQAGEQGWLRAVPLLPDGALVKSFHMSMLKEAKLAWIAAGRDPRKLKTCFRFGDRLVRANWGSWEGRKAHWRMQFAFFMDASAAEHLPYVDMVEECNEYTATSTWASADDTQVCLGSVEAAVAVWNEEIRGRHYLTNDGATLNVPDIQLVLCNGPVSNWIHRRYFELAVQTKNKLGYHPYVKWWRAWIPETPGKPAHWETGRDPTDWREHSGLFDVMEQAHGIHPEWAFTESGLYQNANDGWLHPNVAGGDLDTLLLGHALWWHNVVQTLAWLQDRADSGAWFTSGNVGWQHYQLREAQLIPLAQLARRILVPGTIPIPPVEDDIMPMDPARRARILGHLQVIDERTDAIEKEINAEAILYQVNVVRAVQVRSRVGTPVAAVAGDRLTGVIAPGGTPLDVYEEFALPPHGNRRVIHVDGRNVWADNVQRLP